MSAIDEHRARRAVECEVFALRDALEEEQVVDEDEIERRCDALRAALLAAPGASARPVAAAAADDDCDDCGEASSPVVVLRHFFDDEAIAACFEAAATAARRYPRASKFDAEAALELTASDAHAVLYLHRDGFFARSYAALATKIVRAMVATPIPRRGADADLAVRCVEFHSYATGGSLLVPDHRDLGSALSISVLLSDAFDGGHFLTYDDAGAPVAHVLKRGDAVVFASEEVHHVAPVTRGERHALVVELWAGRGDNTHDRSR